MILICLLSISCQKTIKNDTLVKERTISNEEIFKAISEEEKIKINSVGILVYDGFFELDAFGPYSVFSSMVGTDVYFIAEEKGLVKTSTGIEISVTKEIGEINHLDILVIPGGTIGTVNTSENEKVLNWIKAINESSMYTASVCTGSWILGEAGLLENKNATSNWYRAKEKLENYNAKFIQERWVKDGKLWTSAGVSAGIDMSLAMVNDIKGETYTKLVMLNLEYDPKPPIIGGSVTNTNKGLVNHMTDMYDAIFKAKQKSD